MHPDALATEARAAVDRTPRRHPLRMAAVGLVTSMTLLGVAGLPSLASAAVTNAAEPHGATTTLADWSGGDQWGGWGGSGGAGDSGGSGDSGGYGDSGGSGDSGGYGGSGGSGGSGGYGDSGGGTTSADSQPATATQSKGVVLIDTVLQYAGAEAAGTGMILTSNGQVLTNYHVVEGATKISVTVASSGKTYSATVVGHDVSHDVALLQLKDASGLDPVTIDSDSVAVGDDVTAVGNAGGTGSLSAADGSVTSLTATVTTAAEGTVASETLKSMIETDADVVAGDSGGPLYDNQGEVVGIDTAASTGAEIDGYAIPIKEALGIVDQIRSGNETSTVQVGAAAFLGVLLGGDDSSSYGSQDSLGGWGSYGDDTQGATVSGVVADGPAAKAGIAQGDTITKVGSHSISSADQLTSMMSGYDPGQQVKITWTDTEGGTHSKTVTLGSSPVA